MGKECLMRKMYQGHEWDAIEIHGPDLFNKINQ
jgi:hypothetical protein